MGGPRPGVPRATSLGSGPCTSVFLGFLLLASASLISFPTVKGKGVILTVEMRNIRFNPDLLQVATGDVVTLQVFNNDTQPHTFDQNEYNIHLGTRSDPIQPGRSRNITFTADREGTLWFFCDIVGHAAPRGDGGYTGMAGRLIVGQSTAGPDLGLLLPIGIAAAGVASAGIAVAWWRTRRHPRA